jgi:hypothetical protein
MEGREHNYNEDSAIELQRHEPQIESESKGGLPRVFGSLALAAAATFGAVGMQDAEAGGARYVEINTPQISVLKEGVRALGVKEFQFVQGMQLGVQTEKGTVFFSRDINDTRSGEEKVKNLLAGVSPEQFINEIRRQNTYLPRLLENIPTPNGIFRLTISPYAQEVLNDNHVTYDNGKLSKGKYSVYLTGEGADNPNSECKITGWQEFKNYVYADCFELKIENGEQTISGIRYKINGSDLSVEEIRQ